MKIIAKLKQMDAKELATLNENVRRILANGPEAKKAEASAVQAAIDEERIRRTQVEQERRQAAREVVRDTVKDLGLFDRVVLAFEEMPPADWEVAVLRAIAEHPGRDFQFLARQVGKREGGYINLAVGSLCSARQNYLGTAPWAKDRPGKKNYSSLIIDFTFHREPDGSEWSGWTLKPEAEAALRHLKVI
jgi:hypothetical protein